MTTDTEALRAPQPAAQQVDARVTLPDDIERMAVNRYRPVPSGVLAYKVVGGDGDRSLFSGTKDECQIVARKLTEAFLDGAHVALAAKAETADASDGRWYVLSNDGMATLCADEADAKEVAADADVSYPRMAPHRAVQLVPASELAAAVARERERCAKLCDLSFDRHHAYHMAHETKIKKYSHNLAALACVQIADAIRAGEPSDA